MDITPQLSDDELQQACTEYLQRREAEADPYAGYQGWLHITPEIVDRIMAAQDPEEPV
jgi:hypothetical protein